MSLFRGRWTIVISLLLLIVAIPGCHESRAKSVPESNTPAKKTAAIVEPLILEHDFGLVRPNSKVVHEFEINNPSTNVWNFGKIRNSCACTAPHISAEIIEPNGSASVEVHFAVGPAVGDQVKEVQIEFRETEAPLVRLVVRVRVRTEIMAIPGRLDLGECDPAAKIERTFEIHNYSEQDWTDIRLESMIPWCRIETPTASKVVPGAYEPLPRQIWHAVIQATAAGLNDGLHEGDIVLSAEGPEDIRGVLPVSIRMARKVEAAPRQLFFGDVVTGAKQTKKLQVLFRRDCVPESNDAIELTNPQPEQLALRWTKASGRRWELEAVFEAVGEAGFVGGDVELRSRASQDVLLQIPVRARIVEP